MTEDEKIKVLNITYVEYEIFLTQLYNYIFPPLLHKSLEFYTWFFTEREPKEIFSKKDFPEIINALEGNGIKDIDSLVNRIHSFPIADAIVVKKAIWYKIKKMDGKVDKNIIAPNEPLRAVIDCLQTFFKELP